MRMLSSLFYPKTSPLHNNSLIGCKLEHPMYCVPLNMVLQMTSVERHEVLHARGVLVEHDLSNSEPVIFISHQWVSLNHPDPDAAQFTVLQRAILRLLEGYEVRSDWLHSAVDGKDEVDSSWPSLLKNSSLWYDYFSVPQDANRAEDRQRAIRSIPAYIEMATVMFILAPTVNATDSRESQLETGVYDFSTWQQSGWCRLELLVSHLKPQSRTSVVIRSDKFMHFLATSLWVLTLRVAEGKFSCCTTNHWVVHPDGTASQKECDKVALHGVLKALLRRRLAYERGKSNLRAERQLLAQYHIWLRGLLNVEDTYNIHDSTLDAFLTNYKFATPFEVDEGWTPLRFACISGNVNVARQLLDKKVDVEATLTKAGGKDLFAEKWNTILVQIIAMCCCQEHEDILDLLVAHNANLQPPKHVDAFTAASSCPSPSKRGAFWFLRTFPDWDVNTESSSSEGYLTRRPLCCAVAFSTGIGYAQNLCERKADVTLQAYPVQRVLGPFDELEKKMKDEIVAMWERLSVIEDIKTKMCAVDEVRSVIVDIKHCFASSIEDMEAAARAHRSSLQADFGKISKRVRDLEESVAELLLGEHSVEDVSKIRASLDALVTQRNEDVERINLRFNKLSAHAQNEQCTRADELERRLQPRLEQLEEQIPTIAGLHQHDLGVVRKMLGDVMHKKKDQPESTSRLASRLDHHEDLFRMMRLDLDHIPKRLELLSAELRNDILSTSRVTKEDLGHIVEAKWSLLGSELRDVRDDVHKLQIQMHQRPARSETRYRATSPIQGSGVRPPSPGRVASPIVDHGSDVQQARGADLLAIANLQNSASACDGSVVVLGRRAMWVVPPRGRLVVSAPFDFEGMRCKLRLYPEGVEKQKRLSDGMALFLRMQSPRNRSVRFRFLVDGNALELLDVNVTSEVKDFGTEGIPKLDLDVLHVIVDFLE